MGLCVLCRLLLHLVLLRSSCTLLLLVPLRKSGQRPRLLRARAGAQIGVLAKIESAASVDNLESILDAVDGAMVARGDLGAELPVEEVRWGFDVSISYRPIFPDAHDHPGAELHIEEVCWYSTSAVFPTF